MLDELFDMIGTPNMENPSRGYLGDSQKRTIPSSDEWMEFLELEGIAPYRGKQTTIHSIGSICQEKRRL